MKNNKRCKYCGKISDDVFIELLPNGFEPVCVACKYTNIKNEKIDKQIEDIKVWESKLKKLEWQISTQIIKVTFPDIKFKNMARFKLIDLMKVYPIRKVFEICSLLETNNFSIPEIKKNCKENIKSG